MGRSGGSYSPSHGTAFLPPSVSNTASSSHPNPPNLPESSVSYRAADRGTKSSDHHSSIDESDIVIAVMGPTGSGKSSFINTAAGRTEVVIGNDLNSQTRAVRPIRCLHPDGRRNIVLVDTPGFDDTHLSDTQILRIIAHWLKETYRTNIKLSGLLYLHRISDVRTARTPLRNLAVFKDLCGDDNLKNIFLVTTMWDEVEDQSIGSQREEELFSDFWKDMIRLGSRAGRFQGTCESAWQIINCLDLESTRQRCAPLQIQEEMVDRGLPFLETTAGRTLPRFLVQLAREAKKGWAKLRNGARRKKNRPRAVLSRASTIRSNPSETSWSVVSSTATSIPPISPARSSASGHRVDGRQHTLLATIRALELAHQLADEGHIPMLRGIIEIVLHVAKLIEEMGGTHCVISQVIGTSGLLLDEITQYAVQAQLSKDMRRTLNSFQRELSNLQNVVTKISGRSSFSRFFLHNADIQVIRACITSIKAVYDMLRVTLTVENSQAIARLEDQVTALCQCTALVVMYM